MKSSNEGILDKAQGGQRYRFEGFLFQHAGFVIPGLKSNPNFELVGIFDPASRECQRLSHIFLVIQQVLPCTVKIILNPVKSLSELPTKK